MYGDCVAFVCVFDNACIVIVCVCLRRRVHVCECVCLYGGCVVFVCDSCHVYIVIVCVCVRACMFVNVCAYMVAVLSLYVSLRMCVW